MTYREPPRTVRDREALVGSVLDKTKALLLEFGWTQGAYRNDRGEYCLAGAVHDACRALSIDPYWSIEATVNVMFQRDLNLAWIPPIIWNDSRNRTQGEVIRLIDRVRSGLPA